MKRKSSKGIKKSVPWRLALLPGLCLAATTVAGADTTNAAPVEVPEPLTPEQKFEGGTNAYTNWVDFGMGGFFTTGNKSEFQRNHQKSRLFGGIEDLHYQGKINKETTFSIDGHGILDENNYKLRLGVDREKIGYLRFSIDQGRTWSNGDGGFFSPTDTYFPLLTGPLGLDRREVTIEGGLTLENKPKVTFKYSHNERDGQKGSTIWGASNVTADETRSLAPSFYNIKERSDSIALDVTHTIKKTDVGAGVRYENGKLDDALNINQFPGESIGYKTTDRQGTSYDMFSAHAFTETWLKPNLMFSSGYSFSDLDSTLSGSRLHGTDFGLGNQPVGAFGYYGLNGGSRLNEYVANLNLFYKPTKHFAIIPSLRIQREESDTQVSEVATLQDFSQPYSTDSERNLLDVRERLDLRYTGVTNWAFYGRGEFTQRVGDKEVLGGIGPIDDIGRDQVHQVTDDTSFSQKYSLGTRWYPLRRLSVDAGGYFKRTSYDYDHRVDSTPNLPATGRTYPAFLTMQEFDTYDGNLRLTIRPRNNLSLVSRYEYQFSTIDTTPDPISGLSGVESSEMTSHIIGEDITWSPWSRLYFQGGLSYVLSKTETPASEVTQAILDAQNNYWTLNLSSGLSINDKTDLNVSYLYYLADNYSDNSINGVPYGTGAEQHGITTTLTRRITKNMILSLKYGYYHFNDATFGGNRDYGAHLIYSSLRYRF